jgi:hypothetical protein
MNTPALERRELDDLAASFLTGDAAPATREDTTPTTPAGTPTPTPAAPVVTGDAGLVALREDLANVADQVAALHARGIAGDTRTPHPLATFDTFGAYALAAFHGDADPNLLTRAWADQTLADNDGLNPPSWSTEVRGIVDLGRPFITALGGAVSAGESGMSLAWPHVDPTVDVAGLIAKQATEKTEIHSVKVPIKKATTDLETYAGGSDVALQLIERGDPSYLDAYLRLMSASFGMVTDAAACAAAVAADTKPGTIKADWSDVDSQVLGASLAVQAATGSPASIIGVGTDLYVALATLKDKNGRPLFPSIGASNAYGTAQANGLALDVFGMRAFPVHGLAGKVVVTNGLAIRWAEDGPRTIAAPDVPKLGRDVAVYGYGTTAVYVPAGVKVFSVGAAPAAAPPAK